MHSQCERCLFYGKCFTNKKCEYYTPLDEYSDDEYIDNAIENGRDEYRREWFQYINSD